MLKEPTEEGTLVLLVWAQPSFE